MASPERAKEKAYPCPHRSFERWAIKLLTPLG
jgi:hypothetical protein